jgi:hypothetical protein
MAFNGTGTFVRLYNWVTDKTNSVPITASRTDSEMDGFATGLSNCITKDGQTVLTYNIPMASHKLTELSVGSARTDSISVGQVQDGQFTALGTTGGAADAYTANPSPAITAYTATMEYTAKISATNLTTTPYLQISAIATPASTAVIKKLNAAKSEIAVEASDMLIDGIYNFKRNTANDAWILLNPEKSYQAFNTNLVKGTTSGYGISYLPLQIIITNNTTDANNDIDFTGGVFQFSDGSGQAVAPSLIKRLDASWVAGTNQGGLDTGTKANSTWYYCYAIYNPTTFVADFLFSASPTSPTLPSGFTKSFRIKGAFVKTNSSGNIIPFYHLGRTWTNRTTDYADQVLVAAGSQTGSTATLSSAFPALVNRAMTQIEMALTGAGSSSFSVWGNLQSQTGTGSPIDTTNLRGTSITTNNAFGVSGIGQIFNDNGVLSYRNWDFGGGVGAIKVFLISIEDLTK